MFVPEVYEERRRALRASLRGGLVLLLGAGDAAPQPFRQESNFLYFTGLDRPGLALLMDLDEGQTTLYLDEPPLDTLLWPEATPSRQELAVRAGVDRASSTSRLAERLRKAAGRTLRFLPPTRPEHKLRLLLLLGMHPEHQSLAASVDLARAIAEQRVVKSPAEVLEIERATDIAADMHLAAMRLARPGLPEPELAARVMSIAVASGSDLAGPPLLACRGEGLRPYRKDALLETSRLLLLQAGAETTERYAGTLASTFPVNRSFSARQKELYQLALAMQREAFAALQPGVWFQDVHLRACKVLVEGLKDLGLMKGDTDTLVGQGAHALFFPQGLGHFLGLDVHDMAELGEEWVGHEGRPRSAQFGLHALSIAREIRPGFVFTLEPGISFHPDLIHRWRAERRFPHFIDYPRLEAYEAFGAIRVGDVCHMSEGGARRLGKALPRIPQEVEVIRGGA